MLRCHAHTHAITCMQAKTRIVASFVYSENFDKSCQLRVSLKLFMDRLKRVCVCVWVFTVHVTLPCWLTKPLWDCAVCRLCAAPDIPTGPSVDWNCHIKIVPTWDSKKNTVPQLSCWTATLSDIQNNALTFMQTHLQRETHRAGYSFIFIFISAYIFFPILWKQVSDENEVA